MTDADRKFIGFRLALHLEDSEKEIKKEEKKTGKRLDFAREQLERIEKLTYTEFIPESWHGPKPEYWSKY
jgi:hypothetical protein